MRINLIIKRHWFDEIRAGRKKKEYRDATERMARQICENYKDGEFDGFKPITEILLLNGYHKKRPTMLVECKGIEIEVDAMGEPLGVFVFNLGEILKTENC